ncbi:MAG: ATP-binding protein [Sporocytophaga sp.]|uniref:AAA family ATPase n=1 Tax=Sporocytophaga sp. TaxID=2231183 RepID=UPI001B29A554|nr:ATP-binding protein [Sporocytophaga sp.]MBO9702008.1 ATP-binding protein [Sporocytophaga sp.]
MVIIVSGLPGSGKSFFAEKLSKLLNAEYFSSDIIRKELFQNPAYTDEEKEAVYAEMKIQMNKVLSEKKNVILDATFFKDDLRKSFCKACIQHKTNCKIIIISASDEDIRHRVSLKRPFSDADYSVYLKMKERFELPDTDFLELDSSNCDINLMLTKAVAYLNAN